MPGNGHSLGSQCLGKGLACVLQNQAGSVFFGKVQLPCQIRKGDILPVVVGKEFVDEKGLINGFPER